MKILLAPNYDLAKDIIADATVEAEYGDNLVEGITSTLAHLPKGIENCKAGVYTIENDSPLKFNESMSISDFFFENSVDDICNNKENICVFTDKTIYNYQFQISVDDYCSKDDVISDKENEHRYNLLYMPNVEEIGYSAFGDQTQLTDVYIGNNDITINEFAFDSCVNLERIHLSERLKEIPANCFGYCLSLSNINIPDSVTKIGKAAFF